MFFCIQGKLIGLNQLFKEIISVFSLNSDLGFGILDEFPLKIWLSYQDRAYRFRARGILVCRFSPIYSFCHFSKVNISKSTFQKKIKNYSPFIIVTESVYNFIKI